MKRKNQEAESLMTVLVPAVLKERTIGQVHNLLLERIEGFETINYVYVIDESKKLIGAFSIKEVFRKPKEMKVSDIMKTELVKCRLSTGPERIASLSVRHNLKAVPVVDKDDRLQGVITSDTILSILHNKHIEDILSRSGIARIKDLSSAKAGALVKARFPWLILGLLGGMLAAQIIGFFEGVLENQILLALFIPVIVYLSDAVATQTETLVIRAMAVDYELSLKKYFLREIKVGGLLALILGAALGIFSFLWWQNSSLAIILGLAMFLSVSISVLVAMLIPLVLKKMKKDPALGSGPLATIITDILSITIYFLIANFLLALF